MLAVSFEKVSDAKPIPVKSLVSCENFAGSTSLKDVADQIWTYNQADGWSKYYYYKRGSTVKWCAEGSTTELTDDVTVGPGTGIFFRRASGEAATTLTFAGGVVELSGKKAVDVSAGETKLICNPWPVSITIKNFSVCYAEGSAPAGSTSLKDVADQIWLYDQSKGWSKYYYYKRGSTVKWCPEGSTTEVLDTVEIPAGAGFFFRRASGEANITLSFKGPDAK